VLSEGALNFETCHANKYSTIVEQSSWNVRYLIIVSYRCATSMMVLY